ncbi:MAG: efflux RND transporter periplasmic adaptor subunit, partial [Anaerolineales bacterium]|nr:efflux RND transporter periplasmic adaptor subunit [Anaerolineales bacterium]
VLNPEAGQQVLAELGLTDAEVGSYRVSGLLEADKVQMSTIHGGTILALPAHEGDTIAEGEVIAVLDASLLELQREAAQARVDAAQAMMDNLENAPRDEEIRVAEAAVAQAQALRDAAGRALENVRGAPGAQGYEQRELAAIAAVNQAQAGLDAALALLNDQRDGANDDQRMLAAAAVEATQAELGIIEEAILGQTILAPMDGIIFDLYRHTGETAMPGWPIARIGSLDTLSLTVYIPESDLGVVRLNAIVEVTTPAYPEQIFSGRVSRIASEAEFTPRNVQTPGERIILVYAVEIVIDNPDHVLKPGLSAVVHFEVES